MFGKRKLKQKKNMGLQLELMTLRFNNHLKWSAEALSPDYFKDEIKLITDELTKLTGDFEEDTPLNNLQTNIKSLENRIQAFEVAFEDEKHKISKQPGFHRGMTRIELKKVENEIRDVYSDFIYSLEPKDAYSAKKVFQNYLKHLSHLSRETYDPKINSYNYFKVEMEKIKSSSFDYIDQYER